MGQITNQNLYDTDQIDCIAQHHQIPDTQEFNHLNELLENDFSEHFWTVLKNRNHRVRGHITSPSYSDNLEVEQQAKIISGWEKVADL